MPISSKSLYSPRCIVIAGPNGAGKTTFAREFLTHVGIVRFVNADLIAAGLSPLDPKLAALAAGWLFLAELDRLAQAGESFAFETTMSGNAHLKRLQILKSAGYRIEVIFLRLRSEELAIRRVSERVKEGGHDVPRHDILRRFTRGWNQFMKKYRLVADHWSVYDNSGAIPILTEQSE